MKKYKLKNFDVDSVELKCLLISRGVKVNKSVYRWAKSNNARLDINPLCCSCMILSCGTIVQLTDTKFHLEHLFNKSLRRTGDFATPFILRMQNDKPLLFYEGAEVDEVSFPPASDFYRQHTSSGRPYLGNVVLQGLDWLTFQDKNMPSAMPPEDLYEIVSYAIKNDGINSLQISGESSNENEEKLFTAYLDIIEDVYLEEVILYITSLRDKEVADLYFEMGTSRISCSLEACYLQTLEYIAQRHGPAKAFCNMIIGTEEFSRLAEDASWLAERGILPTASVLTPPDNIKSPDLDYFRKTKEHFAELYTKYKLEPPASRGLNVCVERDIWNFAQK